MTSRSGIRSENRRVGNGRGSSKQAGSVLRRLGATTAFRPSLSFVLLTVFLGVLWIAGGASRGDVPGQIVVRGAAWAVLIVAALFAPKPMLKRERPVLVFLLLALALPILQLVPLPPAIWQALPGRALFTEAATALGETQPWRPIAIVPSATFNAAASLIVPLTILVLIGGLRESERSLLPTVLLGLVATSTLLALLQFSGSRFNNPLINDTVGQISASFANRNHLALFLAYGCLLAPTWAFLKSTQSTFRMVAGLGMLVLFTLMILATGSRAGLVLAAIALVVGPLMVRHGIGKAMRRYPQWVLPVVVGGSVVTLVVAVLTAISSNRAVSINRMFAASGGEDMRGRALPTVLDMISAYFPVGSGLGGFDPIFRIHEPMSLLKLTYFNHAHNDVLEVVLDAGFPGALLLALAVLWWAFASVRAWRSGSDALLARLGSTMIGLTIVASLFDYPARTPMIMAMLVIAACWLCGPKATLEGPALRAEG
jgi:O-antigen ligase